jgi:Flp pilus assembly protein TadD
MDTDEGILEAPESASRKASKQALDETTRDLFDRGSKALTEDRADEALVLLREANERAPDHAQIRSALGLALARAERDFSKARGLCEAAAKQEFFNPELYLNLAKVYLCFGRRSEALRYLRRGQMIDPGHAPIQELIASLGRRRLPLVPFLPRRHLVNRALGNARSKVASVFSKG